MVAWLILHAGIAALATWLARRYALGRALLDHPGDRRSHATPTPRGGGIALVLPLLVAAFALALRDPGQRLLLGAFVAGLSLVAAVGWIDDHRPLPAWVRLMVHAVAGLVFAAAVQFVSGSVGLAVLAFVAVMVLSNVWNFMDGINGIAASQALLLGVALAWLGGGAWTWVALALVAACAGFLPFNFPRARIFMGDVGSGALGFAIAGLGTVVVGRHGAFGGVLLLLPLSAFLVDSSLTLARRVLRGEQWWTAHAQHAYQVWARRSGHAVVTLFYVGWTAVGLALALVLARGEVFMAWMVGAVWYGLAALAWVRVQRFEPMAVSKNNKENG